MDKEYLQEIQGLSERIEMLEQKVSVLERLIEDSPSLNAFKQLKDRIIHMELSLDQ